MGNFEPLVTAVITTYKRKEDVVRRSLESIVNQTYSNIEIFVVNDYPNDEDMAVQIKKLTEEYSDKRKIHYIIVDKNGGACKARNRALKEANGKYFACLDDDDEWLPDKIKLQVHLAEVNPDVAIIYCNAVIRYENSGKEKIKFSNVQSGGDIFQEILAKNNIGSCSFPLMRTVDLREVGGFNIDMPALQDWELYLRLLKNHKAAYIHEKCAIYYRHEGERISAHPENRIVAYENIQVAFQKELDTYKKSASSFYFMGTYFYSISKDLKRAVTYYWKGIMLDPGNLKRNVKNFFRMIGRFFISPKIV